MMTPAAEAAMRMYGIPASFTIAQGAVESGWYYSELAQQHYNLFGIKADAGWKGASVTMPTKEIIGGKEVIIQAAFRSYPTLEAGLEDHAAFLLQNPRYKPAFSHCDNALAFTAAVAAAHYSTNPNYAAEIIKTIQAHNLTQLDDIVRASLTTSK
jgi:flagellar protein FlgJ